MFGLYRQIRFLFFKQENLQIIEHFTRIIECKWKIHMYVQDTNWRSAAIFPFVAHKWIFIAIYLESYNGIH